MANGTLIRDLVKAAFISKVFQLIVFVLSAFYQLFFIFYAKNNYKSTNGSLYVYTIAGAVISFNLIAIINCIKFSFLFDAGGNYVSIYFAYLAYLISIIILLEQLSYVVTPDEYEFYAFFCFVGSIIVSWYVSKWLCLLIRIKILKAGRNADESASNNATKLDDATSNPIIRTAVYTV